MFTGIVEQLGKIRDIRHSKSNIELYIASGFASELSIDQSIAHNGVCLTVDALADDVHRCTLIADTISKTNFSEAQIGDAINLERCVRMDSRLDGHFVQGHVDCTSKCLQVRDLNGSWRFRFVLPMIYSHLVVDKGSISINGVSLTISALATDYFEVSIIPYTYQHTNFHTLHFGSSVNVEFDILGKYIQRRLAIKVD